MQQEEITKWHEETLRGDEYGYYLDCSDGCTVYSYRKTYIAIFKLLCRELFFNKAIPK